jgi:transposase
MPDGHRPATPQVPATDDQFGTHSLELFFLPPYAPELNPDEWVNKNVKHDRIARAVPFTRDDLMKISIDALG